MTYVQIQAMRTWLDRVLEFSWLAAVVVVLLIVLPDNSFVTTVGLPKTAALRTFGSLALIAWIGHGLLWLTLRAVFPVTVPVAQSGIRDRLRRDLSDRFTRQATWLLLSVAALAVVIVLSTLLSIDLTVSTWGKTPGTDGYGLYTSAIFVVFFFTVAFRLRERAQLWRLIYVVAGVGVVSSLIGIAQSFDLWPVQDKVYENRVSGHSGNPIAYGGLLVVLYPMSVAAVVKFGFSRPTISRLWLPMLGVNLVFMYAIALTLSRGPYLGMAVTLVTLLVLTTWAIGLRFGLRLTAATAVSALVVALLMTFAQDESVTQPTVGTRISTTGTVKTRFEIWRAAQQLVAERPVVPGSEGTDNLTVRHLFGYGPDQFKYVVGLTAESSTFTRTISEAHNDFIHRLVETGWLGLVAFLSVFVSAAVLLLVMLNRARSTGKYELAIIAAAIIAALAGRVMEQQVGIARNSDLLIFWLILGVAAAAPRMLLAEAKSADRSSTVRAGLSGSVRIPRMPKPQVAAGYASAVTIGLVLAGALVFTVWQKNVNYLRADNAVQLARNDWNREAQQTIAYYDRAVELAPDVVQYGIEKGNFYATLAENSTSQSQRLTLLHAGYEADIAALEINELERDANFHVAESAWSLAVAGESEKAEEAIERYVFLTEIAPQFALVRTRLEQVSSIVDAASSGTRR